MFGTLVKWSEWREVIWDVVPLVSTQDVAGVCFERGSGELQNAALADGEMRRGMDEAHRLQTVDVILQLRDAHTHQTERLLKVTEPRVRPSIYGDNKEVFVLADYEVKMLCST